MKNEFVVYHVDSTMEVKSYELEHHAFRRAQQMNMNNRLNRSMPFRDNGNEYAVATRKYYNKYIVYMVERTNLRGGKKFMEPSNTPNYMSPASEAYHSM